MHLPRFTHDHTLRAWLWALCFLSTGSLVSGCSRGKAEQRRASSGSELELSELRFEPFVGMVYFPELAEDLGYLAPLKLKYLGSTISGPASIQNVVTGETDFGGAFNGAIIKLVAAKAPIKALIGYYGADAETFMGFYVREDSPIRKGRDLVGKKVGVNTLGAHSEFMWREYLRREGLNDAEIKQTTLVVIPPSNAEQMLRQKQVDVVALSQVFRHKAVERGGIRLLFSDYSVFGEFTAGSLVMTEKFLAQNPNTARRLVQASARAIEWARKAPREEVIARLQKLMRKRGSEAEADAQKYWRSTTVASEKGRLSDKEFQVWLDWMVRDGQLKAGRIRASDLYTNDFQ